MSKIDGNALVNWLKTRGEMYRRTESHGREYEELCHVCNEVIRRIDEESASEKLVSRH